MKTYRMDSEPTRLGICNYERKDDEIIFHELMDILNKDKNIILSEKKEFPYCDIIDGNCEKGTFVVIYDLNYGSEIKSDSKDVLDYLEQVLDRMSTRLNSSH